MSIFEKAFEKRGDKSGPDEGDELLRPLDDFPDITESGDSLIAGQQEGNVGAALPADTGPWDEDANQDDGPGRQIKLDLTGLKAAGLVDPRADKTNRTAEEFRRIKRPLLMHAGGKGASQVENANLIMVTSALAGEGKTFTAINLAMSIAIEMDKTVLLVDADVAKPDVTSRLGVQAEAGLIDVLLDEGSALQDVLLKTDIPKLTLLPSGRRHVHATELLASERMRQLTLELSTRYPDRIVIVDSPPLLLTNEARVLAGLMGQIVVVVEEGRTPQDVVKEAVALLDANEIVGVVLNKGMRRGRGHTAMAMGMVMAMAGNACISHQTRYPPGRPSRVCGRTVALGCLMVSVSVVEAGKWDITPRLSVAEVYSDNINLDDDNKESDLVTVVTPGLSVHGQGGRLVVDLDYELENTVFLDNSDANGSFHKLSADATAEVTRQPDRFLHL